jgi:beta-glucanase (GH16 family)
VARQAKGDKPNFQGPAFVAQNAGEFDKAAAIEGAVVPFNIWYQPNHDFVEVNDFSIIEMKVYKGGPFQEAFSGLSNFNNQWYDGNEYQVYSGTMAMRTRSMRSNIPLEPVVTRPLIPLSCNCSFQRHTVVDEATTFINPKQTDQGQATLSTTPEHILQTKSTRYFQ